MEYYILTKEDQDKKKLFINDIYNNFINYTEDFENALKFNYLANAKAVLTYIESERELDIKFKIAKVTKILDFNIN